MACAETEDDQAKSDERYFNDLDARAEKEEDQTRLMTTYLEQSKHGNLEKEILKEHAAFNARDFEAFRFQHDLESFSSVVEKCAAARVGSKAKLRSLWRDGEDGEELHYTCYYPKIRITMGGSASFEDLVNEDCST